MSAQSTHHSTSSMQEPGRVGLAFLMALVLHVGALVAVTLWQSQEETAPGEQQIAIDFAPAMQEAVSVAPSEVQAIESPPTEVPITEALPIEDQTEEAPEEIVEQVEAEPIEEALAPEVVPAVDPEEAIIAQPLEEKPKPKPAPPKKEERKPDPKPRRVVAERAPPPSNASQGQASASRENMQGAAASADPNILNRYRASVSATLKSRLRYPSSASSRDISGSAGIRFVIDRSGRILSSSLARSSGNPVLDEAALAAARPGSSVPAIPDSLPHTQMPFEITLQFNLRR
ncbi:energy transducer TonB [Microvirga sp. ACRRW]|uniref:TonB family protein n=1 Tax=Microvirga sp. ACRRW TaxID=2918205 RepID=UPI001EF47D39|nr:energy transducer TonB [Microvirga sp. ACRRW]MCG7393630.1 energy transducer TonB [Microvirga sp. ACRRW]